MYSHPNVQVDEKLGFDFSAIADFVKNAATTGLNIYQQQMIAKQQKAMAAQGYVPVATPPKNIINQGGVDWMSIALVGGVVGVGAWFLLKRK